MTGVRANQQPLVNDQNNGKPLTIIRNGQKESSQSELDADGYTPQVEDINNDRTSIYLTSDHVIPLVPSSEEKGSFLNFGPLNTEIYRGAQAIVQSDRIVLNAREESILLSAKEHISLSSTNTHIDGEELSLIHI